MCTHSHCEWVNYLSVEEERRLVEELDPRREGFAITPYEERSPDVKRFQQDAYDLVILLLDTGARYGEISGLELQQVNLIDRTLQLWRPKVQNESVLYMTDRVHRVLSRRYREKEKAPFIFTNRKGAKRENATYS